MLCIKKPNNIGRYRIETNGEGFTITERRFGKYRPLYDCAENLHYFETREQAEEMKKYWEKQDKDRARNIKEFHPVQEV